MSELKKYCVLCGGRFDTIPEDDGHYSAYHYCHQRDIPGTDSEYSFEFIGEFRLSAKLALEAIPERFCKRVEDK